VNSEWKLTKDERRWRMHASRDRTLLLTPCFSGVIPNRLRLKTVSTVYLAYPFALTGDRAGKTVETVLVPGSRTYTPLKRGVNEIVPRPVPFNFLT